jgi:erythromycin esterase-like protein
MAHALQSRDAMSDGSAHEAELSPFVASLADRDRLLRAIGDARFVLIGEASHGTAEFYRERAWLTEELIAEKGFDAVAIEADWPDVFRVHRFVQGETEDHTAEEALRGFTRFPLWMWRNAEIGGFLERLHAQGLRPGIFGLDLYSLHASIDVVLDYLKKSDHDAYLRAKSRYSCFDNFGGDTTAYGYAAGTQLDVSCEREVTQQLLEMQARTLELARRDGGADQDALFQIEQNARLVRDAEAYYRNMIKGSVVTWNLRDRHMADTLGAIVQHLDHRLQRPCKVVLWAHNSHLGDARATQMGAEGELNVGQLVRERWGRDAFLVGFSTNDGTVTAAHEWDEPARKMTVRPALDGSHERFLHEFAERSGRTSFAVLPDEEGHLPPILRKMRLERAIGVIYRPRTERISHYFRARLADQFDAILHLDRTTALEPLDPWSELTNEDAPETFPFAV